MRFQYKTKDQININLTPLIDVVFLLLIFFMVSTTFIKQGRLSITLPQADQNTAQREQQSINLVIDSKGNYTLDGYNLINHQKKNLIQTLKRIIKKLKPAEQNPAFIISADAKAPHQSVVTAMDAAAELGLSKLRISVNND